MKVWEIGNKIQDSHLDVRGVSELDQVEGAVGEVDLERRLLLLLARLVHRRLVPQRGGPGRLLLLLLRLLLLAPQHSERRRGGRGHGSWIAGRRWIGVFFG